MSIAAPIGQVPAPVQQVVVASAQRGITLQLVVRAVLVAFVIGTVILLPPATGAQWCVVIAAAYTVMALLLTGWLARRGRTALRWGWIGLYVDLLALSALCWVAGQSAEQSWTSLVLLGGFFLLPVLAATQLGWIVCASVAVPTVVFYLLEAIATRDANNEPWASIVLRVIVLAGVGAAAVGLSRIQRSRVTAIAGLVSDRATLLTELTSITATERSALAERLHDGALQFILAARMDLDDLRPAAAGAQAALDRLDEALTQSARLLRTAVSELHPAVLEQAGLPVALTALAESAAERAGLALTVDFSRWPADARTAQDELLFGAARELVANVIKHAHAQNLAISLSMSAGRIEMTIHDDGVGTDIPGLADRVREGHIGLHSCRVKIEAAGGRFDLTAPAGGGTTVTITIPTPGAG
ncbi:sensor histidine kinase [Nakamurella sp. GG22]